MDTTGSPHIYILRKHAVQPLLSPSANIGDRPGDDIRLVRPKRSSTNHTRGHGVVRVLASVFAGGGGVGMSARDAAAVEHRRSHHRMEVWRCESERQAHGSPCPLVCEFPCRPTIKGSSACRIREGPGDCEASHPAVAQAGRQVRCKPHMFVVEVVKHSMRVLRSAGTHTRQRQ